jgi:uncharacterized protein
MRYGIGRIAAFAGVISSFALTAPALAASYDCAHTASAHDQLICRSPALSDLDDQLGRAYQARRALLSPRGAALLRNSERSWLHFVTTICPILAPADPRRDPAECLEAKYRERLGQLAEVGKKIGPFVFNRIDLYRTKTDTVTHDGAVPGFYMEHVAYPQIDNQHTPETAAWNRKNIKALSEQEGICDSILGDYDTEYEIGYANQDITSVQWVQSFYCHGAAHGQGRYGTQTMVLHPILRALTAEDMFGPGDGWVEKLQTLFWNALGKSGWKPPEGYERLARQEIRQLVVQPTS